MISFIRRMAACLAVMLAAAGFVAPLPAAAQQDAPSGAAVTLYPVIVEPLPSDGFQLTDTDRSLRVIARATGAVGSPEGRVALVEAVNDVPLSSGLFPGTP
jgi:hypothetical protein